MFRPYRRFLSTRSLPKSIIESIYDVFHNSHVFSLSLRWSNQREMLEKLNMQAVLSASSNETEYVKDSLVTYEKVVDPHIYHANLTMFLKL